MIPDDYEHASLLGLKELEVVFHPVLPHGRITCEEGERAEKTQRIEELANLVLRKDMREKIMEFIDELDYHEYGKVFRALEQFEASSDNGFGVSENEDEEDEDDDGDDMCDD